MKRKSLIIGVLIAVFSACFLTDASAQRGYYHHGYGRYHSYNGYYGGYHRGYYRPRVYVAPPPVYIAPSYGYRRGYYHPRGYYSRPYYGRPYYHGRGYYRRGYWR